MRDTGKRDEHGMQPLDDLSSPEKSPVANGRDTSDDESDLGSDDMEIEDSTQLFGHPIYQLAWLTPS